MNLIAKLILIFILSIKAYTVTYANDAEDKSWWGDFSDYLEEDFKKMGASEEFDSEKGINWVVIPAMYSSPESGLGIVLSSGGLFSVDENNPKTPLSSITIDTYASLKGELGVGINNQTFFKNDENRLFTDFSVGKSPMVFYGVGSDSASSETNKIEYDHRVIAFKSIAYKRVSNSMFLGLGINASHKKTLDDDLSTNNKNTNLRDFPKNSSNLAGVLSLLVDTRDRSIAPSSGYLVQLESHIYRDVGFGRSVFEKHLAEYSHFYSIGDDVIAYQVDLESNNGDVPWNMLSEIGGGKRLRGYVSGQYRDKQSFLAQLEYRQKLSGRHGLVYWGGSGTLSDSLDELGDNKWLPSLGLGYRYELLEGLSLRADLAWADDQTGFYLGIGDAF